MSKQWCVMWKLAGKTDELGPAGPFDSLNEAEEHYIDIKGYVGVEYAYVKVYHKPIEIDPLRLKIFEIDADGL